MAHNIDWTDPCEVLPRLKAAYHRLLAGEAVASIAYTSMGVNRQVTFSRTDIGELRQAITQAEAECAGETGQPVRRRHAIQFGIRRRIY
jgi:hypothetical protein